VGDTGARVCEDGSRRAASPTGQAGGQSSGTGAAVALVLRAMGPGAPVSDPEL